MISIISEKSNMIVTNIVGEKQKQLIYIMTQAGIYHNIYINSISNERYSQINLT